MLGVINALSLGDRPPSAPKQGKHSTITEKCWWHKVRTITDVTHQKEYWKPREWFQRHEVRYENSTYKSGGNRGKFTCGFKQEQN